MTKTPAWRDAFDERQLKEIDFSRLYAADFHHGTDGHNAKLIIAHMADLLDTMDLGVTPAFPPQKEE